MRHSLALVTSMAILAIPAPAQAAVTTFRNEAAITLTDNAAAATYPSSVTTSRLCGTVTRAAVTLTGLTHPNTRDLDLMLVAPNGKKVLFLSDAGAAASGLTVTLDDSVGAAPMPTGSIAAGTYRSTNYGTTTDAFPPGPPTAGTVDSTLTAFNGGMPNGTWRLFARDDSATAAGGTLSGGWALRLLTPDCPPLVPGAGDPFDDGEGGLDPELDGGGGGGTGLGKVALTKLKIAPGRFRTGRAGGAWVTFSLTRAATVTFGVKRKAKGRRSGKKCVAPRRSNRGKKKCTRWPAVKGSLKVSGKAGTNRFRFAGRIGGKALKPGAYRITGQPGSGAEATRSSFVVVG